MPGHADLVDDLALDRERAHPAGNERLGSDGATRTRNLDPIEVRDFFLGGQLGTDLDEELRLEGIAREVVSRIQRLRRDSGLEVSDRIRLEIAAPGDVAIALDRYRDYVAHETLAETLELGEGVAAGGHEVELDGARLRIALSAVK